MGEGATGEGESETVGRGVSEGAAVAEGASGEGESETAGMAVDEASVGAIVDDGGGADAPTVDDPEGVVAVESAPAEGSPSIEGGDALAEGDGGIRASLAGVEGTDPQPARSSSAATINNSQNLPKIRWVTV